MNMPKNDCLIRRQNNYNKEGKSERGKKERKWVCVRNIKKKRNKTS